MLFLSVFVTSVISALSQLASHLFVERWHPKLAFVPRYVIGVLCMLIPPTVTVLLDRDWHSAVTYWVSVIASGAMVWSIRHYEDKQNELRDKLDKLARFERQEETREHGATEEETG